MFYDICEDFSRLHFPRVLIILHAASSFTLLFVLSEEATRSSRKDAQAKHTTSLVSQRHPTRSIDLDYILRASILIVNIQVGTHCQK